MTKMFRDLKKHERNLEKLLQETECSVTMADYDYGEATPVVDMACRVVRLYAKRMDEMKQLISPHAGGEITRKMFSGNVPLMCFDTNQIGHVKVFTNISLNNFHLEAAKELTRYTHCDTLLETFMNTINTDIQDERRKQAWTGAPGRAWKRLKRHETVPLARALARYMNLGDWPDHKIRNLAAAVEEDLKPMELIFADKPEDFIEMYGSGPASCMDHRHNSSWPELIKAKHNPTSFFAYWPHTRGVYVRKKGQVLGRTILYEVEDGKWCYGRVYGNHEQDCRLFIAQLEKAGFTAIDPNWKEGDRPFRFGFYKGAPKGKEYSEFEIPGIKHENGKYMCPIPYFDNIGKDYKHKEWAQIEASFDKDRKVFKFKIGMDVRSNVSTTNQHGMLFEHKLRNRRCACCGNLIDEERRTYEHQTRDAVYCRETCMRADGAVQARRSDGQIVVIDRADALEDILSDGRVFFTNIDAARRHNAAIVRTSPFYMEEYPELSISGWNVKQGDDYFSFSERDYIGLGKTLMYSDQFHKNVVVSSIPNIEVKKQRNIDLDLTAPAFKLIGEIPVDVLEKYEQAEADAAAKKKANAMKKQMEIAEAAAQVAADWDALLSSEAVKISYGEPDHSARNVNIRRA